MGMIALLVAGTAFIACSSDNNIIDEPQTVDPTNAKYTMTVQVTKGEDVQTRALKQGTNDGKNSIDAYWKADEKVIVVQSGEVIGTLKAAASETGSTTLTGMLDRAPGSADLYFYLHSTTRDYTGQVGTLEDISDNHDFMVQNVYRSIFTIDEENRIVSAMYPINFTNNLQSIVRFTLIDNATNLPINATSLTIHDGKNGLLQSVDCLTNNSSRGDVTINLAPANNVIYASLAFILGSADITLTASDGTNTYTCKQKSNVKSFVNGGGYYEITVKMLMSIDCGGTLGSFSDSNGDAWEGSSSGDSGSIGGSIGGWNDNGGDAWE